MSGADELRRELRQLSAAAGVSLPDALVEACAAHFQLLVTWNKTHNLTRITAVAEAARLHYLDCLLPLLAWEAPRSFADVGSGAGFPGLMAALVWPAAEVALVEPSKKRVSFLVVAAAAMGVSQQRLRIVEPGAVLGVERVLSRATLSPGARRPLAGYAGPRGEIVVWGHHHDATTWADELSTWGWTALPPRNYQTPGTEPRCLLRGAPGKERKFHVEHEGKQR